jgi:hypothetical protein
MPQKVQNKANSGCLQFEFKKQSRFNQFGGPGCKQIINYINLDCFLNSNCKHPELALFCTF